MRGTYSSSTYVQRTASRGRLGAVYRAAGWDLIQSAYRPVHLPASAVGTFDFRKNRASLLCDGRSLSAVDGEAAERRADEALFPHSETITFYGTRLPRPYSPDTEGVECE